MQCRRMLVILISNPTYINTSIEQVTLCTEDVSYVTIHYFFLCGLFFL